MYPDESTDEQLPEGFTAPIRPVRSWWYHGIVLAGIALLLAAVLVLSVLIQSRAPASFPLNTAITIEPGLSAAAIADELAAQGVVRSSDLLYIAIILFHDPLEVKAGAYVFREPQSTFSIARQITEDNPQTEHITLTFIEGSSVTDYALVAENRLPEFDPTEFNVGAAKYEGMLFPDTYYVPYTFTVDELIELLLNTYEEQTAELFAVNTTGLSEYEVVTLASIVEREANSEESMRMVAGILQNRMEAGMPLQADASMEYVLDKPLGALTPEDLKIDSPYNTYLYTGLPPTPIGNPGLNSITAVLDPIVSDYYYYLTGNDGVFYYAETYETHLSNIERYLR